MRAPSFLLDTDICILFRTRRVPGVMQRFARLHSGEAVMSVVSYGELRHGAERSPARSSRLRSLEQLASLVRVQDLTRAVANEYGHIRAYLEGRGEVIGANDLWIAAHARSTGLTLVTNNEREFRRVPGLAVENWANAA